MNHWPLVPYQVKARLQIDGSFALPIQHDEPQGPDKVNWLPAPQVGFAMTIKAVWSCARGSGTMRTYRNYKRHFHALTSAAPPSTPASGHALPPAHGPDRSPTGRACHPLGADPPMGRVSACPLAVLDGRVPGADREGPYDHPYHDRPVLCEPGSHHWCPPGQGPTGIGDLYPALRQCHQSAYPFSRSSRTARCSERSSGI
jgi:hypothetical protein